MKETIEEWTEDLELENGDMTLDGLGWVLLGSGVAASMVIALRKDHGVPQWLGSAALLAGGTGLLLRQRHKTIEEVRERVTDELRSLDPIARAQVLKYVAEHSLPFGLGERGSSD